MTWVPSCPECFQNLKGVKRKSRWSYDDHHLKRYRNGTAAVSGAEKGSNTITMSRARQVPSKEPRSELCSDERAKRDRCAIADGAERDRIARAVETRVRSRAKSTRYDSCYPAGTLAASRARTAGKWLSPVPRVAQMGPQARAILPSRAENPKRQDSLAEQRGFEPSVPVRPLCFRVGLLAPVHELRFLLFESPAVAPRTFGFFGQRLVTRRGGGGSLSSLRDSALGVTCIPCRSYAAFRTGNARSPIRRALPLLSPARSSHQFLLVRFPAIFHSSTTSSIRSATSAYPFSRNQWRARSTSDTVRFRYPPPPST